MTLPATVADASTNNGGTTITITKPTGTVDGHVMYAQVVFKGGTMSPPAGWDTLVSALAVASGDDGELMSIYRRVASGEGANYTFTGSASAAKSGGIQTVSGANTTTPEDATSTTGSGASSAPTNPSITTVTPDCLLLLFVGFDTTGAASVPSGATLSYNVGNSGVACTLSTKPAASAGSTGTNVWGSSRNWAAVTVAVAPVATGIVPRLMLLGVG